MGESFARLAFFAGDCLARPGCHTLLAAQGVARARSRALSVTLGLGTAALHGGVSCLHPFSMTYNRRGFHHEQLVT